MVFDRPVSLPRKPRRESLLGSQHTTPWGKAFVPGTRRELRWGKQLEAEAVPFLLIIYDAVAKSDSLVGGDIG